MKTNNVQLVGYIGNHLTSVKSITGNTRAGLSVATHYTQKTNEGGLLYQTVWHEVVAWNNLGDYALRTFVKGSRIMIEGYLNYRDFVTKSGQRQFRTYIIATSIMNLDR